MYFINCFFIDTSTVLVSGLGAAIVIVFLLTAVISSLTTLIIARLYCTKKWSPNSSSSHDMSPRHESVIPMPGIINPVNELEYDKVQDQDRKRVYSYESPLSIKQDPEKESEYDKIVDKRDQDRERVYSYETPASITKPPIQADYESPLSMINTRPDPMQGPSGDVELKSNVAYLPTVNNNVIEMVYDSVRV